MESVRRRSLAISLALLLLLPTSCSLPAVHIGPTATPTPVYTLRQGGACVRLGNTPHPPYQNVRLSNDAHLAHSEPMLAENPENPLNLVGGSKFFTDPAHYRFTIGTYASFDGGCTWTDNGPLPGFATRHDVSDVTLAFGAHNTVYAAVLYTGPGKTTSGIAVSTSTDGGKTFALPVTVYENTTGEFFSDKPWITVDRTNGPYRGSIYVVWSYDAQTSCRTACTADLAFARSMDRGKSFSRVSLIEGQAAFCTNPGDNRPKDSTKCDGALGAIPVVQPDGTIVVAFDYTDLGSGSIPTRILAISSHDGGAIWSNPVLVAQVHDVPFQFRPEKYRNFELPTFATDPRTGQLYLAWEDQHNGDPDILLATSRDAGNTWSAPFRVNDDPLGSQSYHAYQFQPQLAVAPNGVVSVSFFDTRNDPAHRFIDVYLAQSLDHGATFLKNVRVTTHAWDPRVDAPVDGGGAQFIGDYQGLAADNSFVHPFWNDTRAGSQEIYTAAVPSAQSRKP